MAYFDSPKNRAIWNKELAQLRKAREDRSNGLDDYLSKLAASPEKTPVNAKGEPMRERVSFDQLMREEREASGRRVVDRAKTAPTMQRERQKSMQGPQL